MKKKYLIMSGVISSIVLVVAGAYYFNQKQPEPGFNGTRENVTICYYTASSGLIALAQENGFFIRNGLNVTLRLYPIGLKTAFESMFAGECSMATVSETFIATSNKKDFSIFATICTSDNNNKIIARRDSGIQKPEDLKGKRIAMRKGTNSHFFLHVFLLKNRISEDAVTMVFMNTEELPQALVRGDIDAFSMAEPYISRTRELLGDNAVVFSEPGLSINKFNLVAFNSYIKNKPEVIDRTIRALIQAEEYAKMNPDETIKILSQYYGIDKTEISSIMADTSLIVSLDQNLLLMLEDEARWAIKTNQTNMTIVPNYLDYIYPDNLERIKPQAISIIH